MKRILMMVICLLSSCAKPIQLPLLTIETATPIQEVMHDANVIKQSFSISFWVKTTDNKTGTLLLNVGDNEHYLKLTSSGYNEGVYSGLSLSNEKEQWIVADGDKTLLTNRFNQIVITFSNKTVVLYLNGEEIVRGQMNLDLKSDALTFNDEHLITNVVIEDKIVSSHVIQEAFIKGYPSVLLDTIHIENSDDRQSDYWLLNYRIDDVLVNWQTDTPDVIDYRGVIVKDVEKDTVVHLTASIDYKGVFATKTFPVTIAANTAERFLKRDSQLLDNYFPRVMHEGQRLPKELPNGTQVTYEENLNIIDNQLKKRSQDEKETVQITAILKNGESEIRKVYSILLLDSIAGYVMTYFNGEDEAEVGNFAYSKDGLHWEKIDKQLTTTLGTKRVRDPFIQRDKDGNFIILATEGFDNPNIYVFESEDFFDFSKVNLVQVAYYDQGIKLTGKRAWAPEFIYNPVEDEYIIYYSDNEFIENKENVGGKIFAVKTKDFKTFTYPYVYYFPGYSVIDGTVVQHNGYNYLFYKDERKAAQTIFYARSNDLNSFHKTFDEYYLNPIKYVEGPFAFLNEKGTYYIYMDNYPHHQFYVGEFKDFEEQTHIEWLTDFKLPEEDVRHGSVVGVTQRELERILK